MMLLVLVVVAAFVIYNLLTWALSRVRVGNYSNKHVLITGCDRGFGSLLTKRLDVNMKRLGSLEGHLSMDRLGFKVFAACLTSEGADKLQGACSENVTTLLLDVTEEKSIATALHFVESRLPAGTGLWGLVNNAGVGGVTTPAEWATKEDWMQCLSVNLFGVIYVTRAFLPLVRLAKGRVVNTASMLGRIATGPAPYCVSKYGVEAFSDCLRREVYDQGIKVCILEPGYFKTDLLTLDTFINGFKRRHDTTPDEIRQPYRANFSLDSFSRRTQKLCEAGSSDLHLVIDAYEVALTSRFPPTRQLVGNDARFFARLLWNLPDLLTDWILRVVIQFGKD